MKISKFNYTTKQRNIIVCWLFDVKKSLKIKQLTFDLCINLLDCVTSITEKDQTKQNNLQAVAVSCLYLPIIYNDVKHYSLQDMANICNNAYSANYLYKVVIKVLKRCNCNLAVIKANTTNVLYFKENNLTKTQQKMCRYLKNLTYLFKDCSLVNKNVVVSIIECVYRMTGNTYLEQPNDNVVLIYTMYKNILSSRSTHQYDNKQVHLMCDFLENNNKLSINVGNNLLEQQIKTTHIDTIIENIYIYSVDHKFEQGNMLGYGTYGKVYKTVVKDKEKAIKQYTNNTTNDYLYSIVREINNMKVLNHENVCKIEEIYLDKMDCTKNAVLMELMQYSLQDLLNTNKLTTYSRQKHTKTNTITLNQKLKWITEILDGLSYLHSVGLIHRDFCPKNIMVKNDNTISIIDFGSSRICDTSSTIEYTGGPVSVDFRPIEMIIKNNTIYSFEIDVWSCGCVITQLLNNSQIIYGYSETEVLSRILDTFGPVTLNDFQSEKLNLDKINNLIKNNNNDYKNLKKKYPLYCKIIDEMFIYNPKKRLSSKEAFDYFNKLKIEQN